MLTIGQLAAYAGVTVRAVRHYHHVGLLPEPERDASGYRRYGAAAVVSLIRIRTLADAGVPLARIGQLLNASAADFAAEIDRIDGRLRAEIDRLKNSREQIARLTAGDGLALPPEVTAYLDRLREIRVSERIVNGERDAWILVVARRPDRVREFLPGKIAQLSEPRVVRLFQLLSDILDGDDVDDPRLAEAADIMAEQAHAASQLGLGDEAFDDLPHELLDALAVESDPRVRRLQELLRERGWTGWNRMERLAEPPS